MGITRVISGLVTLALSCNWTALMLGKSLHPGPTVIEYPRKQCCVIQLQMDDDVALLPSR